MEKYYTKKFRNDNHFVLYDFNDDIVCYFDNINELSDLISIQIKELVRKFNKLGVNECINICIDKKMYHLYTFVD